MGDLDKLIVDKGFKKLPKVQKIGQSGHTDYNVSPDGEDSLTEISKSVWAFLWA